MKFNLYAGCDDLKTLALLTKQYMHACTIGMNLSQPVYSKKPNMTIT